ncbi:MAG: flagellar assembly protein FliX [Pseudomonadota bacterium]|nr:flagellar assembly protein FliX [Pseudomonadota bacterium]
MKIDGIDRTRKIAKTKGKDRPSSTGDDFGHLISSDATDTSGTVSGPVAVGGSSALLAAQETGDTLEAPKRMIRRGQDLLDKLETLRMALLTGEVTPEMLESLVRLVDQKREAVDNPQLDAMLDEIELRVRVELAKFERT